MTGVRLANSLILIIESLIYQTIFNFPCLTPIDER